MPFILFTIHLYNANEEIETNEYFLVQSCYIYILIYTIFYTVSHDNIYTFDFKLIYHIIHKFSSHKGMSSK